MNPMRNQYLLDSCVFFNHTGKNPDPQVEQILTEIVTKQKIGCISVLTYYEIWNGAFDDSHKRDCKILIKPFKIFTLTKDIAGYASSFYRSLPKNRRSKSIHLDILIAATAEYHRLHLVTLDIKDFTCFPLTTQVTYIEIPQVSSKLT